jgi:hypothetical protein
MPAARTTNAGAELKVRRTLPTVIQAASQNWAAVHKKGAATGETALHLNNNSQNQQT